MFGVDGRATGTARYDIAFTAPYFSVAFDIIAFEAIAGDPSTAQGPGVLTVFLADATVQNFNYFGNATGAPIFVGLVSDTAITQIRWAEALEGTGGNEETALDNFRAVPGTTVIPEPASLVLVITGLAGLAMFARRA